MNRIISAMAIVVAMVCSAHAGDLPKGVKVVGQGMGAAGAGVIESPQAVENARANALKAQAAGDEDKYIVNLVITRLPLVGNGGFREAATPLVRELKQNHNILADVGYRLEPDQIKMPIPENDNDILFFMGDITGRGTNLVSLDMLRFSEWSLDPANALTNNYSLVGGNFDYSPVALGEEVNGDEVNSGSGSRKLRRVIFAGMQTAYFEYDTPAKSADLNGYILSVLRTLRGRLEVVGQGGVILGTAIRTLQVVGQPAADLTLTIQKIGGNVRIGFNPEPFRSVILEKSPTLGVSANWVAVASGNTGDLITEPMDGTSAFYRAFVQGSR